MGAAIVEARPNNSGQDWDSFLEAHQHGSFYHRFAWKRLNEERLGHSTIYLEARDGSQVTGVLPLVLTRSRIFGRILCSMPFVNFGGPVAVDAETSSQLVRAAQDRASRLGVDYLELRCATPLETDMPASLQKVSMTLHLEPDPDQLWKRVTS